MAAGNRSEFIKQLEGDDSIIVDTSAIMAEGSYEFFAELLEVLPKLDTLLIIPQEAIDKVNARLENRVKKIAEAARKAAEWLQRAVDLSAGDDFKVIVVGSAEGAFEEKTILNQVEFLLPNHDVMLITQDMEMTRKARRLRNPSVQGDHKLHCCRITPEGKLGVYRFPHEEI